MVAWDDVRKLTVWQDHTGVECVKWFDALHTVVPIRGNERANIPPRATHKLGPERKVPDTSKETEEKAVLDALISSVEPLVFDKNSRRIYKKMSSEERREFWLKMNNRLLERF